jgi:hypothetical protein
LCGSSLPEERRYLGAAAGADHLDDFLGFEVLLEHLVDIGGRSAAAGGYAPPAAAVNDVGVVALFSSS